MTKNLSKYIYRFWCFSAFDKLELVQRGNLKTEQKARDSHPSGSASEMDELLRRASELQQSDPEQALVLVAELTELAKQDKQLFYLASSQKARGNVHFLRGEIDQAMTCYRSALIQAKKTTDTKLIGDITYNLGRVYTRLKDYPAALKYLQKSLVCRKQVADNKDIQINLNHIGQVYWEMQDFWQALTWFRQAASISDPDISSRQTAVVYNNLGNAYVINDEIPKALEAYSYSLKMKETYGTAADLATAKLNLGNLYYTTTDYQTALGYYLDAEKLYQSTQDKAREAIVQSNLGSTYSELKDYDQAKVYHLKSLEYFRQNGMKENHAKALNNIGNIHLHKAEHQKAIKYYRESLSLKSDLYNSESLAVTYNNLSECFYCLQDYHSALDYTHKSMNLSNKIQNKSMLLKNYTLLGKIYAGLNDYQNAYEALDFYRLLNLEVYSEGKEAVLAKMLAQYDSEGKTKEIVTLKSGQKALEELVQQQVKDKVRYLKLYRSKLDEVKKRTAIQRKMQLLNSELELRIQQALQDYKAQEQIIIQKSKLESLGVMAAGMAHEINQPLSAITIGLNNLRIKAQKSELSEPYITDKISKLTDDIQRIKNVIEHVRLFSRDQVNSIPEQIDLHQTLKDALALIGYDLAKQQIRLEMIFCKENLITVGSKIKLEQVFLNLIANSRDALREKLQNGFNAKQISQIEITTSRHGLKAEIVFQDNGCGMSESCIAKMFDPFYTTKSPEKGTGLGLSICYGIITEMGGNIAVTSEPGSYTRIVVTLPVLEEQN